MPDTESSVTHVGVREFDLLEKLHQERNSAVHLRIAAVEAQARADRELQAVVNQRNADRMDSLSKSVDNVRQEQHEGFKDIKHAMLAVTLLLLLVLVGTFPGLLTVLKVVAH